MKDVFLHLPWLPQPAITNRLGKRFDLLTERIDRLAGIEELLYGGEVIDRRGNVEARLELVFVVAAHPDCKELECLQCNWTGKNWKVYSVTEL